MIKRGIELQMISPSLLVKEMFSNKEFSVCGVCKSKSLFLCHLVCKYRRATFGEFCQIKKDGIK